MGNSCSKSDKKSNTQKTSNVKKVESKNNAKDCIKHAECGSVFEFSKIKNQEQNTKTTLESRSLIWVSNRDKAAKMLHGFQKNE